MSQENTDSTAKQNTLSFCRPKLEQMVEQLDSSEITITFKEPYRKIYTNDEIHAIVKTTFECLPLNGIRELMLVPEYGEKSLHLHYHGVIRGTAKDKSTLQRCIKRRFGERSEIRGIQYTESYVNYILKNKEDEDVEDTIYIKLSDKVPKPKKYTVKLPPLAWDHPLRSTTYRSSMNILNFF